jgi:hypothetical protein
MDKTGGNVAESSRTSWNSAAAFLAGLTGSALLAGVWNTLGFAPMPSQVGYELTHYFSPITWPFVIAYTIISLLLGWITNTKWPVALGMIFTLPIACSVELSRDSTSHNLIPFEILLTWLPGFVLAFGGAYCGHWLRRRTLHP